MSDAEKDFPAVPRDYDIDEIDFNHGAAHVRITGEVTFSELDSGGRSQSVWSWTKQCVIPNGHQEMAAFWQIIRFFVEEKGFSKEEMIDYLEDTADALRAEIDEE